MKATGIVRRLDELGRIVLPKELRRTMELREGDPVEIFVDSEGVFLRKYNPLPTFESNLENLKSLVKEEDTLPNRTAILQKLAELEKLLHKAETT